MVVLHSLPGRVRAKSRRLYDKSMSQYIGIYCDSLYGVKFCRVNHKSGTILILYDEEKTQDALILKNIETAIITVKSNGQAELGQNDKYFMAVSRRDKAKKWFLIYGILYLAFKIKQILFGKFSLSSSVRVLQAASLVTIIGGYPILKRIYKRFAGNIPGDADLLLTLAALSFTILRESSKGILVLWLKELSDYIKYSAEAECRRLLRKNTGKTSGMMYLLGDGEPVLVPVNELCTGDMVEVRKGEISLVDGDVAEGKAVVSSLYHTGQPYISIITAGDRIFEGITVLSGDVKVKITRIPETDNKADLAVNDIGIYRDIQLYTRRITYISLALAVASYAFSRSFLTSLAIMLALSPSAAATAFSSGVKGYISLLNKKNIYIRNPNVFEKLRKVDCVVIDKTGTLTYGSMKIRGIERIDKAYAEAELLKMCAACEVDNYHPISITLQKAGIEYDISKVHSSVLLPSKGIAAQYENRAVLIGNKELMREYGVDISKGLKTYEALEEDLYTPVFVAVDNALTAIIILEDMIRESAAELIRRLEYCGIRDIVLLTGDSRNKARQAALTLGIEKYYGGCSFEDKAEIINNLKKSGTVMMVGDGVNDVLSMRAADVSVSFAASACDIVKLHSDCIIFEDDMPRLADLISLSQKSDRRITQSVFVSNVYNISFGILALFRRIDAFQAKSFNTVNSLIVLLLNQRIHYLSPGSNRGDKNYGEAMEADHKSLPVPQR